MKAEKRGKGSIIIVFLLFVAILLFLMSPLFSIEEITIVGNERFSDKEILDMAEISPGANIFRASYGNGEKKLLENTYIKFAEITTALPNKIGIEVVERKTCGYVPYMGTYLYIDQDGYVLENMASLDSGCPVVTGLKFQDFTIGEPLAVDSKSAFDIVTYMSRLLINYDFLENVREMNIANPQDIRLYVANIDISFGSIEEADRKMRTIIEIIKTIPEEDKGILHIENIGETPYFTYTS